MSRRLKSNILTIGILGRHNTGKTSAYMALTHYNLRTTKDLTSEIDYLEEKEIDISLRKRAKIIDFQISKLKDQDISITVDCIKNVIAKSDIVLILTDFNGYSPLDETICQMAKQNKTPIISIINKMDMHPIPEELLTKIKERSDSVISTSLRFDKDFVTKAREEISKFYPDTLLEKIKFALKKEK